MVMPWIKWLIEFIKNEIPAAIDGKEGGTFSEQVWDWFNTWSKKIILLLFMVSLTLHLVFRFSVIPVILLGIAVGTVIWRKSMFRWDKWLQGVAFSGLVGVISLLPATLEGGVSKGELQALLIAFVGGVALYCKSHPPKLDESPLETLPPPPPEDK